MRSSRRRVVRVPARTRVAARRRHEDQDLIGSGTSRSCRSARRTSARTASRQRPPCPPAGVGARGRGTCGASLLRRACSLSGRPGEPTRSVVMDSGSLAASAALMAQPPARSCWRPSANACSRSRLPGDLAIRVERSAWVEAVRVLPIHRLDFPPVPGLCAVDYLDQDGGRTIRGGAASLLRLEKATSAQDAPPRARPQAPHHHASLPGRELVRARAWTSSASSSKEPNLTRS